MTLIGKYSFCLGFASNMKDIFTSAFYELLRGQKTALGMIRNHYRHFIAYIVIQHDQRLSKMLIGFRLLAVCSHDHTVHYI